MKHAAAIMLLCFAIHSVEAVAAERLKPDGLERAEVLAELSRRSGLPVGELSELLADCDTNQQSMYFCAWRDQIAAERSLAAVLQRKRARMPGCRSILGPEIERWEQARDRSCAASAEREWGSGSMKRTATAVCIAAETERMTRQLEQMDECTIP